MLASFLVDALNVLTGNLDRAGGAMFPLPVAGGPTTRSRGTGPGRGLRWGRWSTRVRGLAEFGGELPLAALAEEIDTPGNERVRALVVVAGNPVLSGPNGRRLEAALPLLDCQISVDVYVNETSRHADVILPSPRMLTRGHAPNFATWNACRNFADYSPPVVPLAPDERGDGEIFVRLAAIVEGRAPNDVDVDADMATMVTGAVARVVQRTPDAVGGLEVDAVLAALGGRPYAEQLLDLNVRTGAYGDRFGARPGGLTLDALRAADDGVDLGALEPRLDEFLATVSGNVELAPAPIAAEADRLATSLAGPLPGILLFGRRDRRSMNSWTHNVEELATETDRCTVQVHPLDAATAGIAPGAAVTVSSRVGAITLPAEVTDAVMPGTVCIPHGFGHARAAATLRRAARTPGASVNDLTDDGVVEPWSGSAVFNGVPVTIAPAD
jgi:anaerobic selenocysteine-containing dehydrogenase